MINYFSPSSLLFVFFNQNLLRYSVIKEIKKKTKEEGDDKVTKMTPS